MEKAGHNLIMLSFLLLGRQSRGNNNMEDRVSKSNGFIDVLSYCDHWSSTLIHRPKLAIDFNFPKLQLLLLLHFYQEKIKS